MPGSFPWLKNHGHIEAVCIFMRNPQIQISFPWLKNHGHIEAAERKWQKQRRSCISMIEKSWPHWSGKRPANLEFTPSDFHDWKIMATLKPDGTEIEYTTLKGISMIEKSWPHWSMKYKTRFSKEYIHFHDWKIMATLKRNSYSYILQYDPEFPWLKNHGHIEA